MTSYRKLEIFLLFSLFLFSTLLFVNNFLVGLFMMSLFGWILTVNTYHDISHFAFSTNNLIENILLPLHFWIYPTFSWLEDHVYTHHGFPNVIKKDLDLERYVGFYKPFKENTLIFQNPISNIVENIIFSDKKIDKYRILKYFNTIFLLQTFIYIIIKVLFIKVLFFNPLVKQGISVAILYTTTPLLIFILSFLVCTQINHIHTSNFVNNTNFYKHHVITSHNVCTDSSFIRLYSGALNMQIEHHLFPSVNSCHLYELSKIVKPLCLKYNVKYNESISLLDTINDTLKTSKKLTSKTMFDFDFKII